MDHQDDYDVNEVTSSAEIAEQKKRQLQHEIEAEQRMYEEVERLRDDERVTINLCERNKRSLDRQAARVENAFVKTVAAISKNDAYLETLAVYKEALEVNIKSAKEEISDLKKKLKKWKYCHQKGMRRNKFFHILMKEEGSLMAELAELRKGLV